MEVIPTSHVYVKDKIFNPDPGIRRSVVCLYIHGFESLWEFMIQHLIGEAQGVHSPSVSSRAATCCRLLLHPVLIPDWCSISMIIVVTIIPRWSLSSGPVDGSGRTGLFVQELS